MYPVPPLGNDVRDESADLVASACDMPHLNLQSIATSGPKS